MNTDDVGNNKLVKTPQQNSVVSVLGYVRLKVVQRSSHGVGFNVKKKREKYETHLMDNIYFFRYKFPLIRQKKKWLSQKIKERKKKFLKPCFVLKSLVS